MDQDVDRDAQDICRDLQHQLLDMEKSRQQDRLELAQRAEKEKVVWEKENKELKDRNNVVSLRFKVNLIECNILLIEEVKLLSLSVQRVCKCNRNARLEIVG